MKNEIKTCNATNQKVIRDGSSNDLLLLRGFCILKEVDDGSGFITIEQANKALGIFLGKSYNLTNLSRIPEHKMYWGIAKNSGGVHLRSWSSVWATHGIQSPVWVLIPANAFRSRKLFKAWAYNSWLSGRMVSRAVIAELWNLTKTSQIRYERLLRTHKEFRAIQLTNEQALDLCSRDAVNPDALQALPDGSGYTRQVSNYYVNPKIKSFTTAYIQQFCAANVTISNPSTTRPSADNFDYVLWLTQKHLNRYGKPMPKQYDGTKTYAPGTTKLNGMTVMERVGTYAY